MVKSFVGKVVGPAEIEAIRREDRRHYSYEMAVSVGRLDRSYPLLIPHGGTIAAKGPSNSLLQHT